MKESEKALLPDLYELNPATGRYRKKKKSKKNEKVKDNFLSLPSPQMVQVATFDQPTKQQLELDQLRKDLIESKERLVQLEKAKENKEQVIQPVVSSLPVVLTEEEIQSERQKEKKEIKVEESTIKQKEREKEEEEEEEQQQQQQQNRRSELLIKQKEDKKKGLETIMKRINKKLNFKNWNEFNKYIKENPTSLNEFEINLIANKLDINYAIDQLKEKNDTTQISKVEEYLNHIDSLEAVDFTGTGKNISSTQFVDVDKEILSLLKQRIKIISALEHKDTIKLIDEDSGNSVISDPIIPSLSKKPEKQPDPSSDPEQNPEVGQQTNVSAEQVPIDPSTTQKTVEVPKDKFSPKYHINSIIFYFGNSNPQWDFVLQNNLDKLDISKETIKKLSRDIVDSYGHRFLIDEVKSDGDKVELNELLQLQILFESSMIKRGSHALMKVSDLVKFQSKLAANNKPQQQTIPQVIDGVADDAQQQQQVELMNNNQQKAIPEQTQTQENVPINEIVTVTQSKLSADILEAYENKHTYDNGKIIITPKVHIPEEIIPVFLPDPEFSFGKRLRRKNKY